MTKKTIHVSVAIFSYFLNETLKVKKTKSTPWTDVTGDQRYDLNWLITQTLMKGLPFRRDHQWDM